MLNVSLDTELLPQIVLFVNGYKVMNAYPKYVEPCRYQNIMYWV